MNLPTPVRRAESRFGLVGLLVVAACLAACALPIVGGLAAGEFLDRVLDSPAFLAVLVGIGAALTIAVVRRRKGRSNGC